MTGKENIDRYVEASKTLDELYGLTDWVADKLGSIYISGVGYYEFKDIERKGDRYEITVDWTVSGETNYGETFTVPADLCEKCFCKETRDEAYAELKKIKDEERRIREAEEKVKFEKAQAEQKAFEKERRRKQYEELKKEFGE
jgi:hypothetical protein